MRSAGRAVHVHERVDDEEAVHSYAGRECPRALTVVGSLIRPFGFRAPQPIVVTARADLPSEQPAGRSASRTRQARTAPGSAPVDRSNWRRYAAYDGGSRPTCAPDRD